MARLILAGPSEEKRGQLARLLASSGFSVHRSCASGGSLRRAIADSEDCIVILLGLLPDCKPDELVWDYRDRVQVLLIARPEILGDCESPEVFRLALPTTGQAVLGSVEMLSQLQRRQRPKRQGTEKSTVEEAKKILMERLRIPEPEAHRMIQKYAMDHGIRMIDYAARIIGNG